MKPTNLEQNDSKSAVESKPLFLIHDPAKLWLVESGNVDLFLVEVKDGALVGARHHIMRVGKGRAVFGFGTPSTSMRLVAATTTDSEVLEITHDRISDLSEERITRFVENWITDLSRVAAGDALPKNFDFLEPGKVLTVKESKAMVPREGVVWVRTVEGNATFLGNSDFPMTNGRSLLPIPASAWLQAGKNCRLSILNTADYFKLDPLWTGLHGFQSRIL